jgi:hypothetical protein
MDVNEITTELTKFDTTAAAIAELSRQYMALEIKGIDDRDGFEACHVARIHIKQKRVAVEKRAKELRADAVRFQKECIAVEKDIVSKLQPIYDYLEDQENRVLEARAQIKAEAEAKIAAIIQARVNRLFAMGCRFDGMNYTYGSIVAPQALVKTCTDDQFEQLCRKIAEVIEGELTVKAAEETARKAEADRLAKIAEEQNRVAAEQAKERERLAAEGKAIQDEKDRLACEAKAAQDAILKAEQDKLRAIELEKAKAEAAEKARLAEIERVRVEAEEKARKEEKTRVAAERKAQRRPDKEKLLAYSRAISDIPAPDLKHDEFIALLTTTTNEINQVLADLNKRLEEM